MKPQSVIPEPVPDPARHRFFDLDPATDPRAALQALTAACPLVGNAVDLSAQG